MGKQLFTGGVKVRQSTVRQEQTPPLFRVGKKRLKRMNLGQLCQGLGQQQMCGINFTENIGGADSPHAKYKLKTS